MENAIPEKYDGEQRYKKGMLDTHGNDILYAVHSGAFVIFSPFSSKWKYSVAT